MAGKRVETPVTLTNDVSKLLKCFKEINLSGESDFVTAVNISMLLLKHRQNKNQKQRILMFVVSPIKNSIDELVLLGKKLKKNNIAIDIISFGNVDVNHEPLLQLQSNANNSNNSNLLEVTPDQYVIDSLFISPILNDNLFEDHNQNIPPSNENIVNNNNNTNNASSTITNNNNQGGISQFERDINLAIQQSIEEEERRKKAAEETNNPNKDAGTEVQNNTNNNNNNIDIDEEDLANELEKARLMSIKEHENNIKQEKDKEKKLKEDIIDDEDFIKGVMDEIGIPDDNNKNEGDENNKDNKNSSNNKK